MGHWRDHSRRLDIGPDRSKCFRHRGPDQTDGPPRDLSGQAGPTHRSSNRHQQTPRPHRRTPRATGEALRGLAVSWGSPRKCAKFRGGIYAPAFGATPHRGGTLGRRWSRSDHLLLHTPSDLYRGSKRPAANDGAYLSPNSNRPTR